MPFHDKKAVSPLIATVLLVMIVVSIGAAVMLVLKGITEENMEASDETVGQLSCGSDVGLEVVQIEKSNQICLETDTLSTIVRNTGSKDIVSLKFSAIGTGGVHNNDTMITLSGGDARLVNFSFPAAIGSIKQIKISVAFILMPQNKIVYCLDNEISYAVDAISACPLP